MKTSRKTRWFALLLLAVLCLSQTVWAEQTQEEQDEGPVEAIRQAQKQWLKERNACTDAGCVKLAYTERLRELAAEPKTTVSKPDNPRFTVTQGKGWTVCESYAKYLNALPESEPLPLCHLKLSPDFPDLKEPDWEELDIAGHIELVYSLEKLTFPTDHNRPVDNFEHWQAVFEQQIKSGEASPRLRCVHLALINGGPVETILAYEPDRNACDKEVKKRGYANYGERTRLFLWDEQKKKIQEYGSRMAFFGGLPQQLLMFQGRPFTFLTFWGGRKSPGRDIISGEINVRHFTDKTDEATPYTTIPRCQIGYELTPRISKRIIK